MLIYRNRAGTFMHTFETLKGDHRSLKNSYNERKTQKPPRLPKLLLTD